MKYLTLIVLLGLTGCTTSQELAKGVENKSVILTGGAFVAKVTPYDEVSSSPTGKIVIGNAFYASTVVGKPYYVKRTTSTPKVLGFFGGSKTSTIIISANSIEELQAIGEIVTLKRRPDD
jgi:hypothetical protein